MRLSFGMIAILLLFVSGCIVGEKGSGVSKTEDREVDDFHQVALNGSGEVNIKVGGAKSVTITFDDNLIEKVETEVENGKLTINVRGSYSTSIGLNIEIVVPSLDGFSVSGSGDATISDIDAESFETKISGSGSVQATGKAGSVEARISGSGDMNLKELAASDANVSISGSGSIIVNASESVSASISGSGDVDVWGESPKVTKTISGSGDVTVHGAAR